MCDPLAKTINKWQQTKGCNNWVIRASASIDENVLSVFASILQSNWNEIKPEGRDAVRELLQMLDVLYHTQFLYNNQKLSGFKRTHTLWGLRNNLILDANGSSNSTYNARNMALIPTHRIINYENSKLHWVRFNSSQGNIKKNQAMYLELIAELIASRRGANDKTLVVCHNTFEESVVKELEKHGLAVWQDGEYSGECIAVTHYGNLVGKNDYGEFTQCWIIGTPNIPMDAHVIHKSQYANKELLQERYHMHRHGQAYKFVDDEFERVRFDYVVGEIYQAIKRVQRNALPRAEIFLVTHNGEIHVAVADKFQNIQFGDEIELEIGSQHKSSTKDAKIEALKAHLMDMPSGAYTKQEIYDAVCLNPSNASRYWKNLHITRMVDAGVIEIRHTKVIKF